MTAHTTPCDSAPASRVPSADLVAQARAYLARPDAPREQLEQYLTALIAEVERAQHCPLTGLWTRDAWTRQATQMIATGGPCAVIFIDLDGFKAINDGLDHDAGDALLTATGARLATWCERTDGLPARFGGDEFVALLPAAAVDDVATRSVLREELTTPVPHDGQQLGVGASIGVAAVAPGPQETAPARLSAALHAADRAMYRDKALRRGGQTTDRRGRLVTSAPTR